MKLDFHCHILPGLDDGAKTVDDVTVSHQVRGNAETMTFAGVTSGAATVAMTGDNTVSYTGGDASVLYGGTYQNLNLGENNRAANADVTVEKVFTIGGTLSGTGNLTLNGSIEDGANAAINKTAGTVAYNFENAHIVKGTYHGLTIREDGAVFQGNTTVNGAFNSDSAGMSMVTGDNLSLSLNGAVEGEGTSLI